MGPAKFTQHYEVDAKGVITGVLRFESVKSKSPWTKRWRCAMRCWRAYKQDMI